MTTVFIDGLGLIGASLATFIKEKESAITILANDLHEENLAYMQTQGLIDGGVSFEEGAVKADLILLATPVTVICDRLRLLSTLPLKKNVLVTDVGSSKVQIEDAAQALVKKGFAFLAGHPMAGSHLTGARNADVERLRHHTYFLIKRGASATQIAFFKDLMGAAGFDFHIVDAKTHDQIVAASSHLPHMAAFALASTVAKKQAESETDWGKPAAGFMDATRIAKADPTMWTSIFNSNPQEILSALNDFESELQGLKQSILSQSQDQLLAALEETQQARIEMENIT